MIGQEYQARSAMKHSLLLGLLCGCLNLNAAYALSLDEAIAASLSYESQLKLKELMLQQSETVLEQAKKSHGLTINLQGQYDLERIDTASNTLLQAGGNRHGRSLQLQLDYPIYTSGRHQLGIDIAESQRAAQRESLQDRQAQTIIQTVMVYTDVLKKQAILDLKESIYKNLQRALYEAQRKFAVSVITRADLALVEAQLAQGFSDISQAESELSISQTEFQQITGVQPIALSIDQLLPSLPYSLEEMLLRVDQHPAVKQAILEKTAVEQQYQLSKRELKPSAMLLSRISTQEEASYIGSESDNYMLGVQFNMPLYNGALNKANLRKAYADIQIADQKIEVIQRQLSQQLHSDYAHLRAIRQNKKAIALHVNSASIALEYIRKELEFGSKSTYDLITAEQNLIDVKTQQVLNNQDEILLSYQLLAEIGRLDQAFAQAQK